MLREEVGQVLPGWMEGVSKREIARRAEVTRQAVQRWARGLCLPLPDRVPALGAACGRTEEEIAAVVAALS